MNSEKRCLMLAAACGHQWVPEVSRGVQTLIGLVTINENDRSVFVYPAKLVSVTEAQGEYVRATVSIPIPNRTVPSITPGPCALQFYDPEKDVDQALLGLGSFPKRLGLLASIVSSVRVEWDRSVPWAEVEVFALSPNDTNPLRRLLELGVTLKEYDSVTTSSPVIHQALNSYGEVVGVVYGPRTVTCRLDRAAETSVESRFPALREAGFFKPHRFDNVQMDMVKLPVNIRDAVQDAARLATLLEKFNPAPVMERLAERFEESEKERWQREEAERQAAFARSMRRGRRITRD